MKRSQKLGLLTLARPYSLGLVRVVGQLHANANRVDPVLIDFVGAKAANDWLFNLAASEPKKRAELKAVMAAHQAGYAAVARDIFHQNRAPY